MKPTQIVSPKDKRTRYQLRYCSRDRNRRWYSANIESGLICGAERLAGLYGAELSATERLFVDVASDGRDAIARKANLTGKVRKGAAGLMFCLVSEALRKGWMMPVALPVPITALAKFRGFFCAQRRLYLKGLVARVSQNEPGVGKAAVPLGT